MNITERSKEYAKGKALDAITAAIEQAYADGYNDGLKHLENEMLEAIKDGVEYKDLGLPSGTLWSSRYVNFDDGISSKARIRRIPFMETSQLSIPTKDDYEELYSECIAQIVDKTDCYGLKFTGVNGESIIIQFTDSEGGLSKSGNPYNFRFWLNENSEKKNERKAAAITWKNNSPTPHFLDIFMGLRLPIMLVKKRG